MRRLAILLTGLGVLAGCGDSGDRATRTPTGWTTFHDAAGGVTVRFPSSWHRATESLTPNLLEPREILSLGTFPLAAGPHGHCSQMPVPALREAGAHDVFLTVQEREGAVRDERSFPPRTEPFDLGAADDSEAQACVGGERRPWRSHWVAFSDAGRPLYLLALIGEDAPPERVHELREVLDGLEFTRTRRFSLPQNVDGRLADGWNLIERRLAAAVGAEQQIAAGTFTVPAGPPDGNCTPAPALRRIDPDDAFVYAFEYAGDPGGRDPFPPRPPHFALDEESLQPYECVGVSYLLRWREHGRWFQAHLSFGEDAGADRRREALELLDNLAVGPAPDRDEE